MTVYHCMICRTYKTNDHDTMKEHITKDPHHNYDSKWFTHMKLEEERGTKK